MELSLTPAVFQIDAAKVTEQISAFIEAKRIEMHRDGALVSLSGGLDSSTVLALTVRAMGPEHVKALLLPEKQGNPDADKYARQVAAWLGVKIIIRDLSSILSTIGTYNFVLSRIPSRQARALVFQTYFTHHSQNPFLEIARGEGDEMMRRGFSLFNSKQRVRLVVEYMVAEQNNLLVVGAAHKSEDLVGLYVKFGVDDNADLMPLKNLYRTQTLLLAEYLEVPEEIRQRTPNPDLIPGVEDKYMNILGIPPETIDLVLYGLDHGMSDSVISIQVGVPEKKVGEIRALVRDTEHMRTASQAPELKI
ncbi:MAG TPA: NAD(+) synthase [Anaerolineaceae bacterium]|nr:NAD(+) synthase [Anaerolineaceae bacterium]